MATICLVATEARAQLAGPRTDPLAGEVWRVPTAVIPDVGTRVLRLEGGGGEYRDENPPPSRIATGRLAFSVVALSGLDLQVGASLAPLDTSRGPLDGSLLVRWAPLNEGAFRLAWLGDAHFGGTYAERTNNHRVASFGSGLVATACGRRCRGAASLQASFDIHDVSYTADFSSGAYRTGRANAAATVTLPLAARLSLSAAGRAGMTVLCTSGYEGGPGCIGRRAGVASAGGRWAWTEQGVALDVGVSLLRGPLYEGTKDFTMIVGRALVSVAWGWPDSRELD